MLNIVGSYAQDGILYTLKDGLSNSSINDICQDDDGFIWIATNYGLNRFDGLDFKVFNLTNNQSQIINTNRFNAIDIDKQGRLLVGTQNGLYYFDSKKEMFEPITIAEIPELSQNQISNIIIDKKENVWLSISGLGVVCIARNTETTYSLKLKRFQSTFESVSCLFESSDNAIWVGTRSSGAFKISSDFSNISHYHVSAKENFSIVGDCVYTIAEDTKGNIIVGVFEKGISIINPKHGNTRSISLKKECPQSLICCILVDTNNRIIVGSDAGGLYLLDSQEMRLIPYALSIQHINMRESKVHALYEDKFQNLWVAVHQKGLIVIPKESKSYLFIGCDPYNNNFPNNSILSITQDEQQNLWIGTDGGGLVKSNLQTGETKVFAQNSLNQFPDNIVLATYSDQETLWVGTYLSGAIKMNTKTGKQTRYVHNPDKNSISSNYINAIAIDLDKRVWFGTGDYGICNLSTEGVFSSLYEFTNQNYIFGFIYNLYCDRSNNLWIASENGVFMIDIKNRTLDYQSAINTTLLNSAIYCIREDKQGIIWLSNINGLIQYNPVTTEVKILHPQNRKGNNLVNAIEIDDDGDIWGSTNSGIFRYQPSENMFNYYPAYVGLPDNEFNVGVSFKSEQNDIFFGGIIGISHFFPAENEVKRGVQQVQLIELNIHNETVTVKENKKPEFDRILTKPIVRTDTIRLAYNQNYFSIRFAPLEYAFSERVYYKYILKGNDVTWRETSSQNNTVHYTSISPGEYTFKVMASFDPLFSSYTERDLTIIINPPIWLTWWAKVLYVLFSISLICYIFWHMIRRIKTAQELLREKQAADILEAQLESFTNISHEIRTPLTLIIGILRRLIKGKEENTENSYRMMMNSSKKILELTNQLLDVHLLNAGAMELQVDYINVIDYVEETIEVFRPLASETNLSISLYHDMEILDAIIDPEAFRKIIYNLLGNSIKFTPQGGSIEVAVKWTDDVETFKIIVTDTGIGIPEDKLYNIFDRYYNSPVTTRSERGVGIGLHLVKSLVELMNGEITVCSEIGKGTAFTIILPIVGKKSKPKTNLNDDEQIESVDELEQKIIKTNYKIVLVEDNEEILNFISEELSPYYKTIKFSTATEAYKYILENQIDLIVSDAMMPDLDGFKFCRMIKTNPKTELIPFILLTAKTDHQSLLRGAKEGADTYITKPFMTEILIANINNLITVRRTMNGKYSRNYEIGTAEKINEYKKPDDELIERFISIVKSQIDNPDLSIESLSKEMGISRANLYRKIKNITNLTPSVFIRNIRLEQATSLLKKKISSSEVAYIVGFNSHSYFSKLFHEYYGCSPSEYISQSDNSNFSHNI